MKLGCICPMKKNETDTPGVCSRYIPHYHYCSYIKMFLSYKIISCIRAKILLNISNIYIFELHTGIIITTAELL